MRLLLSTILAVFALALPASGKAQSTAEIMAQDLRLASIADAMLVANATLCRNTMPVPGLIFHSADQYGDAADALFPNGPLAIAYVLPGSPADLAGLRANDPVISIGSTPISALTPEGEEHLREAAFFNLAELPDDGLVSLSVEQEGQLREVSFEAPRGCRALVEILLSDGPNARSDGRIIQLQFGFAATLTDEQVAVVLAHELAHVVLEHRRKKEEAGIDNESIMRHLGRNQQVNRQAEVEADRLSVHLLANAGYDPLVAATFWRSPEGVRAGGGPMPSFIYPSQEARAAMIEREVAMFLPLRTGPTWPGHLVELRERGFSAD